jgi:hypothetical protein
MRLWPVLLGLGAAGCYLDDRQSQQMAKDAHARLRPGMTLVEVVRLVDQPPPQDQWVLSAEECSRRAEGVAVRFSPQERAYVVETFRSEDRHEGSVGRTLHPTQESLLEAARREPLATCRSFELAFGPWAVPFRLGGSARVEQVSPPRFTD